MHSHISYIYMACVHCVFSHVSSSYSPILTQSHIGCNSMFFACILMTFLQDEFSNVSSSWLHEMMRSHIGCIWKTFLQNELSNESSSCELDSMRSHIGCIWKTFLLSELSNESSSCELDLMRNHIGCIWKTFFLSELSNVASNVDHHQEPRWHHSTPCLFAIHPRASCHFGWQNHWTCWWWVVINILSKSENSLGQDRATSLFCTFFLFFCARRITFFC